MSASHEICTGGNAWKNIRRRFWRNEAKQAGAVELWGKDNVKRMKGGLAPRKMALVRPNGCDYLKEVYLSCELHHVFGIHDIPTDNETVVMVWPHQHALIDLDRIVDFEFIKWLDN